MEADPVIEEMLNENPLIGFSIYTDIQSKTVQNLGREILECLQTGFRLIPTAVLGQCVTGRW